MRSGGCERVEGSQHVRTTATGNSSWFPHSMMSIDTRHQKKVRIRRLKAGDSALVQRARRRRFVRVVHLRHFPGSSKQPLRPQNYFGKLEDFIYLLHGLSGICHRLGIADTGNINLSYCSHRRDYRIWGTRKDCRPG